MILIDLAVPRDIDPEVGELQNVTLYDIDSFKIDAASPRLRASMQKAGAILDEQMSEFYNWFSGRDVFPRIQDIKTEAVEDLNARILKILKKTPMEDSDREKLLKAIDTAAGKVVNKMIFGLRDSLEQDAFMECVAGLEKVYED